MNYKKHYDLLIQKGRNRSILKGEYKESHHIVPKALGGGNEDSNLVDLFPEEHLLAHLLLAHIHGGTMWQAAFMMTNSRKLNNKSYKWVKEKNSKTLKEFYKTNSHHRKGVKFTEEHKQKLRDAKKGGFSDEHKKKLKKAKKDFVPWNKGLKGVQKHSEETKLKMKESAKNRKKVA